MTLESCAMSRLLHVLRQGCDVVVLVGAYVKIAALVGLYSLEKAYRALVSGVAGSSRGLGHNPRQRRR